MGSTLLHYAKFPRIWRVFGFSVSMLVLSVSSSLCLLTCVVKSVTNMSKCTTSYSKYRECVTVSWVALDFSTLYFYFGKYLIKHVLILILRLSSSRFWTNKFTPGLKHFFKPFENSVVWGLVPEVSWWLKQVSPRSWSAASASWMTFLNQASSVHGFQIHHPGIPFFF